MRAAVLSLPGAKARLALVPDSVTKVSIQKFMGFVLGGLQAHGDQQREGSTQALESYVKRCFAFELQASKRTAQQPRCFPSENDRDLLAAGPGCF